MTINETAYMIDQAVVDFVETGIANGETEAMDRIAQRNLLLAMIGKEDLDTKLEPSQILPERLLYVCRAVGSRRSKKMKTCWPYGQISFI